MRIRSIKPEFWASEDVAALPWPTRLLFIGLWSYVDDNGVGRDNERLILADLFPLEDDPRETLATVSEGLQDLSERGMITRYEASGRRLLHITTWERHQKIDHPNKPRYTPPTCEDRETREPVATPSRKSRETLSPGTEEQRNRGTEEKNTARAPRRADSDPDFDRFWTAYPRKVGKGQAATAWRSALKKAQPDELIGAAKRYADSVRETDPKFIAHPATWLNGERWDDEPAPATPDKPRHTGHAAWMN